MRQTQNLSRLTAVLATGYCLIAASEASAAAVTMQAQAAQQSEGFANSAIYNGGFGTAPGQQNQSISGSQRDASGNLVIVNGILAGSGTVSQQDGFHQSGVGGTASSATAIGNNLNVTVTGTWNTVIVNSKQTNNGNQNASTSLNGSLKF